MGKFVFFWQSGSPFSQWHASPFVVGDQKFHCAEQWMMYQKAVLFKDAHIAKQILKHSNPKDVKQLGREISGFKNTVWKDYREGIVYVGNYHKFTQNKDILPQLLNSKGTLVEASPYDDIWGIKMEKTDPRANNPSQWAGLNLLGFILTQLREDLNGAGNPSNITIATAEPVKFTEIRVSKVVI